MPAQTMRRFGMTHWVLLLAFGGALALRLWLAAQMTGPFSADPTHYLLVARNVYAGRGLEVDYVWHYLRPPATITHPIDYWGPLTSWVIAASLWIAGDSYFAALLPAIVCSLLVAGVTYMLAREIGLDGGGQR